MDSRVPGWRTSRIAVHHGNKILLERFLSGLPIKMAASTNRARIRRFCRSSQMSSGALSSNPASMSFQSAPPGRPLN